MTTSSSGHFGWRKRHFPRSAIRGSGASERSRATAVVLAQGFEAGKFDENGTMFGKQKITRSALLRSTQVGKQSQSAISSLHVCGCPNRCSAWKEERKIHPDPPAWAFEPETEERKRAMGPQHNRRLDWARA
jgi:hypothetical protein